jgi:hypothetical protein
MANFYSAHNDLIVNLDHVMAVRKIRGLTQIVFTGGSFSEMLEPDDGDRLQAICMNSQVRPSSNEPPTNTPSTRAALLDSLAERNLIAREHVCWLDPKDGKEYFLAFYTRGKSSSVRGWLRQVGPDGDGKWIDRDSGHFTQAFPHYLDRTLRLTPPRSFDLEEAYRDGLPLDVREAFEQQVQDAEESGIWPPQG